MYKKKLRVITFEFNLVGPQALIWIDGTETVGPNERIVFVFFRSPTEHLKKSQRDRQNFHRFHSINHVTSNHAIKIFPLTLKIISFIFNREMLRGHFQCSDWELLLIRHRCWGNDNHLLENVPPQSAWLALHHSSPPSSYSVPWESYWGVLWGHSFYKFKSTEKPFNINLSCF